jgi:hypothetical protein
MPVAVLDTMRPVKYACMVLLGADDLRRHVPGVAVGVIIHHRIIADGVEATR